ncbi:hypothetical protein J1N35_025574 [Gossypium stocksii]|uniref:Uncharacterized protein n=1 Tax=Gossypium stocksii TaxID=47602 RepID=A0A9D3ZXT8_9ROSI|nr:hypothetical protein J1N35_025574 [Gossypium stocksii]
MTFGRKINVGRIISKKFIVAYKKRQENVNFLSLLETLCQYGNVLVHNNEETISNRGVVMKSIILSYLGKDMPQPSRPASTLSSLPEALHTFNDMFEQQVINTLKQFQH